MDIPFVIFALYTAIALIIGIIGIIMGIKRIAGAPFITVIAGFMFLLQVIFIDNIEIDYQTNLIDTISGGITTVSESVLDSEYILNDAVASSEKTNTVYDVNTSNAEVSNCTNCSTQANAILFDTGSSLIGSQIQSVTMYIRKDNAGSAGTVNVEHRNSADAILDSVTFNMNTLSTSSADKTVTFTSPITISAGDRLVLFVTTPNSNTVWTSYNSVDQFDGANTRGQRLIGGVWSNQGGDWRWQLDVTHVADNVYDGSIDTVWENNVIMENGAYIYIDTNSNDTESVAFKLNHQDASKIIDDVKIRVSNSTSDFGSIVEVIDIDSSVTGVKTYNFTEPYVGRYYMFEVDSFGNANYWQVAELELWSGVITTSEITEPQSYTYQDPIPVEWAFNQYDTWVFTILLGLIFVFIGIMLQYSDWRK